jgi:tetratricopeptide (TPR) repeat protein
MLMRTFALLPALLLLPAALIAQAPAPSLGDRVKAERPAVDKLMADLQFPEALKRAESLLPATKPAFDKTDNQALVQSAVTYMDLGQAYRMAVETADAAGSWEKALEYAKTAKALSAESYAAIKEPFTQTAAYYTQAGVRAKQVLEENDAHIKELKGKSVLDPGERQELDLAIGVEKEVVESAKWVKFFQTYLDVVKRESEAYDPLVKVMEDKLKGEADQVADYKAGKGEKTKWVEAVVSSPAYLEAQGDKAGKARFLYRLSVLDPENKKVQKQLDVLFGRATATPAKPVKKGKKG